MKTLTRILIFVTLLFVTLQGALAIVTPPSNMNGYGTYTISNYASIGTVNSTINNTGIFYGTNKALARTKSQVVCRGDNATDDIYKAYTCDYICPSTTSDCSKVLQNAINSKNHIYLTDAQNNYTYNTTLNLSDNEVLECESWNTKLVYVGFNGSAIQNSNRTNGNSNIQVKNCFIDARGDLKADINFDYGIRFDGVTNFVLQNNYLQNSKSDLLNIKQSTASNGTSSGSVLNNYFSNSTREGLQFEFGSNIIISGNHLFNIYNRGINVENFVENGAMNNIIIANNEMHNTGGGVVINNVNGVKSMSGIVIAGNVIRDSFNTCPGVYCNDVTGIQVLHIGTTDNISNVLISGNTIINISANQSKNSDGIMVRSLSARNIEVVNNMIYNTGRYGIYASSEGLYAQNTIDTTGSNGINADGTRIKLSGNEVKNTNGTGIYLSSCKYCVVEQNRVYNTNPVANSQAIIETSNGGNVTIQGNYVYGSNVTWGIRVLDALSTVKNNVVYDAVTKYSISEANVIVDDYKYATLPTCNSSILVVDQSTLFNGSLCRCTSSAWKCATLS